MLRSQYSDNLRAADRVRLYVRRSRAADPQPYRVDLAATGDASMDATLHATSDLIALRKSAPVSPFGLIARARSEIDRLKTVLESYGYYQSKVTIQIDGMALNAPASPMRWPHCRRISEARVAVSFVSGPALSYAHRHHRW